MTRNRARIKLSLDYNFDKFEKLHVDSRGDYERPHQPSMLLAANGPAEAARLPRPDKETVPGIVKRLE